MGLGLTGRAASLPAQGAYRPELIHLGSRFKYFPDLNKKMENKPDVFEKHPKAAACRSRSSQATRLRCPGLFLGHAVLRQSKKNGPEGPFPSIKINIFFKTHH